jgi:23S rRNA (cytidine1920-2'-O)/16S rRNA (cytidine1409-2'-O)-methyltransferase
MAEGAHHNRLDVELVARGLVMSRSQAESYIKLGKVRLNSKITDKPGLKVKPSDDIQLILKDLYVSRAGHKLESANRKFKVEFRNKIVLDVGSSTGGFTDFALRHGAKKILAVDVGTDQLHKTLRNDPRVELYEKTDIRNFAKSYPLAKGSLSKQHIDIVIIDVSFISLRQVLPAVSLLANGETLIIAMAKPQFEVPSAYTHKGVIKNENVRRNTLADLENWVKKLFKVVDKIDSEVVGEKGNKERFYLLKKLDKR